MWQDEMIYTMLTNCIDGESLLDCVRISRKVPQLWNISEKMSSYCAQNSDFRWRFSLSNLKMMIWSERFIIEYYVTFTSNSSISVFRNNNIIIRETIELTKRYGTSSKGSSVSQYGSEFTCFVLRASHWQMKGLLSKTMNIPESIVSCHIVFIIWYSTIQMIHVIWHWNCTWSSVTRTWNYFCDSDMTFINYQDNLRLSIMMWDDIDDPYLTYDHIDDSNFLTFSLLSFGRLFSIDLFRFISVFPLWRVFESLQKTWQIPKSVCSKVRSRRHKK